MKSPFYFVELSGICQRHSFGRTPDLPDFIGALSQLSLLLFLKRNHDFCTTSISFHTALHPIWKQIPSGKAIPRGCRSLLLKSNPNYVGKSSFLNLRFGQCKIYCSFYFVGYRRSISRPYFRDILWS